MRARLDRAMGPVPASTIDVDALVARGRRQHRARRAGLAGGGGALAVLLGVTLATGVASPLAAPSGSGPSPGPSAASELPVTEPPVVAEARLTAVLTLLVREYAPAVTAVPDDTGRPALAVRREYGGGQAGFAGSADLVVPGGPAGNLWIGIGLPRIDWSVPAGCDPLLDAGRCVSWTGADGERIVRVTGAADVSVYVTRVDGTGVIVLGSAPAPLAADKLVAIGTDPRWTLHP